MGSETGSGKGVATVVVTCNGIRWIDDCLQSLLGSGLPSDVIVVDNASTDGTPERIRDQFPKVTLLRNEVNIGFGRGNNRGIRLALEKGAEQVFLLNQDARVKSTTLRNLIPLQKEHPEYGILSPMHLNGKGTGLEYNFCRYALQPSLCSKPVQPGSAGDAGAATNTADDAGAATNTADDAGAATNTADDVGAAADSSGDSGAVTDSAGNTGASGAAAKNESDSGNSNTSSGKMNVPAGINPDHPSQPDYPSQPVHNNLLEDLFFGRHRHKIYEVSFVNAAAWLVSRRCFEKIGGFHPAFFVYGEDDEFLMRAQKNGFKAGVCPEAVIMHDREPFRDRENDPRLEKILEREMRVLFFHPGLTWKQKQMRWRSVLIRTFVRSVGSRDRKSWNAFWMRYRIGRKVKKSLHNGDPVWALWEDDFTATYK